MRTKLLGILLLLAEISCYAQWDYDTLSEKKVNMGVAVLNNKIYFHSGSKKIGSSSVLVDKADIFDVSTKTRQTTPLPSGSARSLAASAVTGTKVIFGGGNIGEPSNKVDIYDTTTGNWTTSALSLDRWFLAGGAASNGKVFFAGGYSKSITNYTDVINIYNNGVWTSTAFPFSIPPGARQNLTIASIGNKVFFAGGDVSTPYHDLINIYNAATNQWLTTQALSERKTQLASVVYKNKIYFAGGQAQNPVTNAFYNSDTIDIYNSSTDSWEIMKIPRLMKASYGSTSTRHYSQAATAGCKMFLVPVASPGATGSADTIAVYDFARNTWSYLPLPHPRTMVTIAAAKNKVYFAGGAGTTPATNGVWYNHVDIFTLQPKLQLAVNNIVSTEHNFNSLLVGEQKDTTIQLSNEGDFDLIFPVTKVVVTGDLTSFTVDYSAIPDTLEPAEIVSIPVVFEPVSEGDKEITISLYSSDPQNPVSNFSVKGTGTLAASTLSSTNAESLQIFPNPTNGIFTLHTANTQAFHVEITNGQGTILKTGEYNNDSSIDISTFNPGLYFLKITGNNSTTVTKIIKK